jgi:hypothetical protein
MFQFSQFSALLYGSQYLAPGFLISLRATEVIVIISNKGIRHSLRMSSEPVEDRIGNLLYIPPPPGLVFILSLSLSLIVFNR